LPAYRWAWWGPYFLSGSLITAPIAQETGRELSARPGSPLDPRSRGGNDLVRQRAHRTETARDAEPTCDWVEPPESAADRAHTRKQVAELLGISPTAVDDVVRRCQFSPAAVMAVLLELELAGRIQTLSGNRVALMPDTGF